MIEKISASRRSVVDWKWSRGGVEVVVFGPKVSDPVLPFKRHDSTLQHNWSIDMMLPSSLSTQKGQERPRFGWQTPKSWWSYRVETDYQT